MIQRIQSVYLLLAGIMASAFTLVNPYALQKIDAQFLVNYSTSICAALSAVLALCTIFLFRNRKMQMVLIHISLFFALLSLGLYVFIDGLMNFYLDWQFYFLPVLLLVLFLARRGVKKDEELIKSSYRLR